MRKNTDGQFIACQMLDDAGVPVTTGTTFSFYVGDNNATQVAGPVMAHKGNGCWVGAVNATMSNFDHIAWTFTNDAGGVTSTLNIYTTSLDPDTAYAREAQLPATLDSGRVKANTEALANDAGAATNLAAGANQLYPFTVGASPTATTIPTGITGAPYTNPNHFEKAIVLINQERRRVNASGGSPVVLTTEPFNSVPSENDAGVIS